MFYLYTITVMLVCVTTGALALASYFVSRNRAHLYLMALFFFYFLDLVLIFQYEYFNVHLTYSMEEFYGVDQPVFKTLLAAGSLQAMWLLVCEGLNVRQRAARIVPVVAFVLICAAILAALPESALRQYLYYEMRQVFLLGMLVFAGVRYLSEHDEVERLRLRRFLPMCLVFLALTICIVAEDTFTILIWTPEPTAESTLLPLYVSERNFSENVLAIIMAAFSLKYSAQTLQLRYNEPPTPTSEARQRHVEDLLPAYCVRHKLTQRERDVLALVLQGKDNQNIAGELQLALGTVKAHTHNILKKTETTTRQELIRDFWKD